MRSVGLLVVVTIVAACGGAGGQGDDTLDTSGSESGEETLGQFFGWDGDPAEQEARWRDQDAQVQELIRQCMAEEGFEYIPVRQPEGSFSVSWDEEEWTRTRGFGITTWFGNEDEFDQGLEWEDPNQETVEAMSDTERDAYYAALHGSQEDWESEAITEVDPETGEEFQYFEGWGFGCEGQASEQVYGGMDQTNDLWEEINPQMEAMYQRIQADPRMVELNEEWSACMADAGYEIASRDALWDWEGDGALADLQQRFDELVGDYWAFDPFENWTEADWEERTQEEIEAIWQQAEQDRQANVDQEALAAIQQEEIDLAVANFECTQDVDLDEAYQEVSREYEADFIAANRSLLEQIREAQGG